MTVRAEANMGNAISLISIFLFSRRLFSFFHFIFHHFCRQHTSSWRSPWKIKINLKNQQESHRVRQMCLMWLRRLCRKNSSEINFTLRLRWTCKWIRTKFSGHNRFFFLKMKLGHTHTTHKHYGMFIPHAMVSNDEERERKKKDVPKNWRQLKIRIQRSSDRLKLYAMNQFRLQNVCVRATTEFHWVCSCVHFVSPTLK